MELMSTDQEILTPLYRAFNARDMERSLNAMRSDVIWANGMEGRYVYGHVTESLSPYRAASGRAAPTSRADSRPSMIRERFAG